MPNIYTFVVSGTCKHPEKGEGSFRLSEDALHQGQAIGQVVYDLTGAGYTNVKVEKVELTRFVREVSNVPKI